MKSVALPIIDLLQYKSNENAALCEYASKSLHMYGALCIKDPRVTEQDNENFLNMMEKYFEVTDFVEDARPQLHYQVGVTPERKERPKNHCEFAKTLSKLDAPKTLCPPELDKKCRFFWRIGSRPETTEFQELNAEPVVPKGFPEWESTMNMWGNKLLNAVEDLAEMISIGFGWPKDTLRNAMKYGPHLLAPTGSNFNVHRALGDILAGFHYDLNLLTVHGKSRYPGLFIWLRDGTRTAVQVPDGCLLVQAGKQLEYLTGGYVKAGYHEVVVSEDTIQAIKDRETKKQCLWRVSSTLFAHSASDAVLKPLYSFATAETNDAYPQIKAGDQVLEELKQIELGFTHDSK